MHEARLQLFTVFLFQTSKMNPPEGILFGGGGGGGVSAGRGITYPRGCLKNE